MLHIYLSVLERSHSGENKTRRYQVNSRISVFFSGSLEPLPNESRMCDHGILDVEMGREKRSCCGFTVLY